MDAFSLAMDYISWHNFGEFTFNEIYAAIDIAFSQYYEGDSETWNYAFNKLGGICYNRHNNKNAWD